jgi:hypothetical protein
MWMQKQLSGKKKPGLQQQGTRISESESINGETSCKETQALKLKSMQVVSGFSSPWKEDLSRRKRKKGKNQRTKGRRLTVLANELTYLI